MREGRSGKGLGHQVHLSRNGRDNSLWSFEERVIDGFFVTRAMIRPVSEEAGWRQANLIHGRWIRPDPSSIALYDALGEPVPIVWRAPELHQWFLDQGFDLDYEEP